MAQLLSTQGLTKSFGQRSLFTDITFGIEDGEQLGLIGPNGSGKLTLMRLLAGFDKPDAGVISRRRGVRFGYVAQQDTFADGATVGSVLRAALVEQGLDDSDRDTRTFVMSGRVGFQNLDQPANTLSGGWRKRLSIAAELIREPDVLLMDEPTNHLDVEGILWLEELLADASFAYVVVSHDRYFLEHVTTRIVELNAAYPQGYLSVSGSYSEFLIKREEFLAAQQHHEVVLANQVRREIEWLRRGPPARTTKAKYRIEEAGAKIEHLSDLRDRNASKTVGRINFTGSGRKTRDLLVATDIARSVGERTLFSHVDITLSPGVRLGLLGPNGSGKTTLIRTLTGAEDCSDFHIAPGTVDCDVPAVPADLQSVTGEIKRADRLKFVWFEQDRSHLRTDIALKTALSPESDMVTYRGSSMHVSAWASRFLFRSEQLEVPVSKLSGGEQARILIAGLMLAPADILILDEPTNDLDIPTLEILEESLIDFPGAMILVTHDRYMLDRVSTIVLALDGRGGHGWYADYSQWANRPSAKIETALATTKPTARGAGAATQSIVQTSRTFQGLTRPEQRELDRMESAIGEAEAELARLQEVMAGPAVATDYIKLQEYMTKVAAQERTVEALYSRWQELEAKREVR